MNIRSSHQANADNLVNRLFSANSTDYKTLSTAFLNRKLSLSDKQIIIKFAFLNVKKEYNTLKAHPPVTEYATLDNLDKLATLKKVITSLNDINLELKNLKQAELDPPSRLTR